MRLEQLQYIIEIEKEKSISKAAKSLYIGQPALSASLSSLEKEIGVNIFERSTSGVIPTGEGIEIIKIAQEILKLQNQLLNYGKEHLELYGDVTVLTTQAYSFLYSDIILAFKEKFPKANLNLEVRTPEKLVEDIKNGIANIGLTIWELFPEQNQNVLIDSDLRFKTFGEHSMMVYVSQDNRFADNESIALSELRDENFISYSSSFWAATNRKIKTESEAIIMNDRENLKRLISDGQAIALMPETFAFHDLYCNQGYIKLIPIKGSENFGVGKDYLIYPENRRLTLLEENVLIMLDSILSKTLL